jgi:hypothetical protein
MNKAKLKYKKQCKQKVITFYKHEKDLLDFANSINFQGFVKQCLKCELDYKKAKENGEVVVSLNAEDYIGE